MGYIVLYNTAARPVICRGFRAKWFYVHFSSFLSYICRNKWHKIVYRLCFLGVITHEYYISLGRCPQGIWYSWVNTFSYFPHQHAINVFWKRSHSEISRNLKVILHQFWVKKSFPWKFNLKYDGTFTKLFMDVSSRNMLPTTRNLQIRVHVYRPRHCCGDWLTFGCFVPMIADHDLVKKR